MRAHVLFTLSTFLLLDSTPFAAGYASDPNADNAWAVYARLQPTADLHAGDPAFDTVYGLAALDSGKTVEAVAAFERVLAVQPDQHAVRTELARAYERLGDLEAAKRELQTVSGAPEGVPQGVRSNLSAYASVLDKQLAGGPRTVHGEARIGLGFDSNVNTATAAEALVIPAFAALGPARLSRTAQARDDLFAEAGATMTLQNPIRMDTSLFATGNVTARKLFSENAYDQANVNVQGGIQYRTPDHGDVVAGLGAGMMVLDGEGYSHDYGAFGQWRKTLADGSVLGVFGNYAYLDYDSSMENRDAHRLVAGVNLGKRMSDMPYSPYIFGSIYGGGEKTTERALDFHSHTLAGVQAGAEAMLTPELVAYADARYEARNYDENFPLFLEKREDRQWDVSAGLKYAVNPHLVVQPAVAYRTAQSNIGFYDYDRWVSSIHVKYGF